MDAAGGSRVAAGTPQLKQKLMKLCEVTKIPVQIAEQWAEEKRRQEVERRRMEVIRAGKQGDALRRKVAEANRQQRRAENYFMAMASVDRVHNLAQSCQSAGRTKKRAKNTFSKKEAGTCTEYITVKRFRNSRLTCICKTKGF